MEQATTIGLDIAKHVFQAHGADAAGHVLFRKRLTRAKLLGFFSSADARASSRWKPAPARITGRVRSPSWATRCGLIPPAYVKPFVKRQKNDAADAEAICEAAQRPSMRFVPVKNEEQQANGVVFRARDLLVHQRTQCINALRGHLCRIRLRLSEGHYACCNPGRSDRGSDSPHLPDSARTILKAADRHLHRAGDADRRSWMPRSTGARRQTRSHGG